MDCINNNICVLKHYTIMITNENRTMGKAILVVLSVDLDVQ